MARGKLCFSQVLGYRDDVYGLGSLLVDVLLF